MSRYQKFVILLACLVIAGMCVYPPKYVKLYKDRYKLIGHYYLHSQPGYVDNSMVLSCRIDKERLAVQFLIVIVITAGLFIIGPKRKVKKKQNNNTHA